MSISKIIAVASLVIASMQSSGAQSLEAFCEKLSLFERNDEYEFVQYANVEIREEESAKRALEALIAQESEEAEGGVKSVSTQGYRIGVFFDNSAKARATAESVMQRCDSLLKDIPATLSYDNPYFKVSAGYCVSLEEAVMVLHRVQRYFPNAYLMREQITPQDLVKVRAAELNAKGIEEEVIEEVIEEKEVGATESEPQSEVGATLPL